MTINKRRVSGFGCFHKGLTAFVSKRIKTNGNQLKAVVGRRIEFISQCLPHGQVSRASSVGGPGVDHHFFAAQARQIKGLAVESGQR